MHYPRTLAIITIMIIAGFIAATGCSKHPAVNQEKAAGRADDNISHVLYPLNSAVADITSFDSLNRMHMDDSIQVRAYTIRAEDLLDALGMPPSLADSAFCTYKHIRVYLAYRKHVGFKLFLVPVDGANLSKAIPGKDMLLDSIGDVVTHSTKQLTESLYVLDLNAPCPNTCATGTPLSPLSKP